MKKAHYKINIERNAGKVYDTMLGISDKSTYEKWTATFNPTSTYEGNWMKGHKMRFIGTDEKGDIGGIVSKIHDILPSCFVSIRHYGLVKGNAELTEGPEVEKWANAYENYTFDEINGITTVTVDLDTTDDFLDYMNETYPKALAKLKEICENE